MSDKPWKAHERQVAPPIIPQCSSWEGCEASLCPLDKSFGLALFGDGKQLNLHALRLIHEAKKQGGRIVNE